MNLLYDNKFHWLIVEVKEPELKTLADLICEENLQPDWKEKEIRGILYRKAGTPSKKTSPLLVVLPILLWIAMFGLVGLGTIKLLEILNRIF